MEVGQMVKMKKKHRKGFYGSLDFIFGSHNIRGSIKGRESFKEAVSELIACAGLGIVNRVVDEDTAHVTFRNTFEGQLFEYEGYFEIQGLKVI